MKELLIAFHGALFIMSAVVLVITGINALGCNDYSDATGRATEFRFFSGCYVQHGDRLIPKDEYKFVELKEH